MRITLIGYGKMGRMVEELAGQQDHTVIHRIDIDNPASPDGFSGDWVEKTDVIIDFSLGETVPINIQNAVRAKIPIIEGTTGWDDQLTAVRQMVESGGGTCVYASNFSVGVQCLFHLTREAGRLMSRFQDFHPFIQEAHHAQKVDAPSGTALTLEEMLMESYSSPIPTSAVRAGFIPGNHLVGFDSPVDTLALEHRARGRQGFAHGALFAAQWVQGKTGFFKFEDILFGEAE